MSGESSTVAASSKSGERPKSKIFDSVKRVFTIKKKDGKKSAPSTPEVEKPAPELPVPAVETKSETPVVAAPAEASTEATKPIPRIPRVSRRPPPGPPPPIQTPAERAQALFKKHGLEFVPTQWAQTTPRPVERVHKEIRMRVHRQCHKCNTSYGADPKCLSCGHRRCKQCPRFPSKKDKGKDIITTSLILSPKTRSITAAQLVLTRRSRGGFVGLAASVLRRLRERKSVMGVVRTATILA